MDSRQNELLKEIIESYIKTVKPVGSKSLCEKFGLSSATIRNEMASLEELGLLEKNHISSGRIPSEKGYKYYVEHLMEPKKLTGEDVLKLQTIFNNKSLAINDAISACMDIISDLTNYTSIVLGSSAEFNTLKQLTIIPIDESKVVALLCTSKGIVESKQFLINEEIDVNEIIKVSEIINKKLYGTPITEINEKLELVIKPLIREDISKYETVYNIFYDAFNEFVKKTSEVHISGKTKLFDQPEYSSINDIKRLANKFEDTEVVRKIERNDEDGNINIYIGEENEFDNDVTVVKSKITIDGEASTIAIVGPKRMEYARVVGLLEYIKNNLNDRKE